MNYKAVISADVHWSQYSSIIRKRGPVYSSRLMNLIKSVEWVEQLAVDNKCDEVISLGDFFDKPSLNSEEITALQEVKFSNIPHKFIVGNHESDINTLQYSSTSIFKSFNSEIINEIKVVHLNNEIDLYFIPFITCDKAIPLADIIEDKNKKNIVFAHQDIAGLTYGKFTSQNGFDLEDIKEHCTLFIDGHLHNECIIDNKVLLVGNLTGQNFNEDAFNHRHLSYILTIDDNNINLEPYENPYAFNFYHIKIENKNDLNVFNNIKDNAVISISCLDSLKDDVLKIVENNPKISEYRLSMFYLQREFNSNGEQIIKVENHFKQFIEFAQEKLEYSPALEDELSRLEASSAVKV